MQNPALNQRVSIDKYHGLRLHINTPAKKKNKWKEQDIQQQPKANKKNESDQNKIIL